MPNSKIIKAGGHKIELGNPDKKIFPKDNITKADMAEYYSRVAKYFIRYSKKRPISMNRFPDGINKSGFYHKQVPNYFPKYIKTKKVNLEQGGKRDLAIVDEEADLVFLADQGCVEIHTWLSTSEHIRRPDQIVFDLDPPKKEDFELVKFAARKLKMIFEKKKMHPFVMATGSKGLHVVIPIKPSHKFDIVREFAKKIASELAEKYPDKLTLEMRKNKRKGRLFLDYTRNAYGQTTIAPYSLRAIPGAPIAAPLDWDELASMKNSQKYNISNIFRRLGAKSDPWQGMEKKATRLKI